MVVLAVAMWADNRNDSSATSPTAAQPSSTSAHNHATGAGLTSYAGTAPENATELAAAHKAFPAELPPAAPGALADVNLVLKDVTIEIAPGIKYAAWAWAGGAPGP